MEDDGPVQYSRGRLSSCWRTTASAITSDNRNTSAVQVAPVRRRCRVVISRLLALCVIILLFLGFFVFIMIPCPPEFRLDSASVNSFNLSSDSHQISTNWNISIFLRNSFAEWTSISYEALQVMVLYEERIISAGSIMVSDLQGTEKKKKKAMVVQGSLGATSVHVDDWLRNAILKERSAYGVVDFTVTVEATVRIRLGLGLLVHTGRVWVPCYHVKMELPSNSTLGTIVGGSRKCQALVDFKSLGPF